MAKKKQQGGPFADYESGFHHYEEAHVHFLRAIQKKAKIVLADLRNSVLPLWPSIEDVEERDPNPLKITFTINAQPLYRFVAAIWDWAARYRLIKAQDVGSLINFYTKHDPFICSFLVRVEDADMDKRLSMFAIMSYFSGHVAPRHPSVATTLSPESPWFIFGAGTLLRVVMSTLSNWLHPTRKRLLVWRIPQLPRFSDRIARNKSGHAFKVSRFSFRVKGWNIFQESRIAAERRIIENLQLQLRQEMDKIVETSQMTAGAHKLFKPRQIINRMQFDWLALYQVNGWSARKIAKTLPQEGQLIDDIEKRVTLGIHHAAELVVGPHWRTWLRKTAKTGQPKTQL